MIRDGFGGVVNVEAVLNVCCVLRVMVEKERGWMDRYMWVEGMCGLVLI